MPSSPPQFYKYMRKGHAEQLVNNGSLRIGTLLDFQNTEKHGQAIGDSNEGIRITEILTNPFGKVTIINNGATFVDSNVSVEYIETSAQYYIFCVSLASDAMVMKKMGYDTCVQINYPPIFFRILTLELLHIGKLRDPKNGDLLNEMSPCQYNGNEVLDGKTNSSVVVNKKKIPIYLHKNPEFAYQTEARCIWIPKESNPEPFFITVEPLKHFCKIIDIK